MKSKIIQCRTLSAFAFAALLAFSATTQNVSGQTTGNCTPELSSGADLDKQLVRIGDTITVTAVSASTPALGCSLREITGYLVKPNLNTQTIFTGGALDPNQCIRCPSIAVCVGTATCVPGVSLTYVVAAADIGKPISGTFTAPDGSLQTLSRSAVPFHVQFFPTALGRVPAVPLGNRSGEIPAGQGQATARVITPCITITKTCVTTCPPGSTGNTPYGLPIQFSGTVCNTGNNNQPDPTGAHDLVNITVTDSPAAAITFAATTSLGNPFDPVTNNRLRPGECVNYTGSYQPTGNLCGPFQDTITATAVDATQNTISNTDPCWTTIGGTNYTSSGPRPPVTATCTVCTAPCIDVVKECLTPVVQAGQPAVYRIRVRNCGDVPLQNVVLRDDSFTPGNTADDVVINIPGQLAPGAFFPGPTASGWITNQIITTPAQCAGGGRITNTVVATGVNICPPPQTQTVMDTAVCDVQVVCQPRICVEKLVTCVTPGVTCANTAGYAKTAAGVRGADDPNCPQDNGCPAFCYKITVRNCGEVPLVNVSATDDNGTPGNTADDILFPIPDLAPGQTANPVFYSSTRCNDTHNIVEAVGTGAGIRTNAFDFADVDVVPISVRCVTTLIAQFDMDTNDPCLVLPAGFTGDVTDGFRLEVCNNGQAPVNVAATVSLPPGIGLANCTDVAGAPVDLANLGRFDPGQCKTYICDLTGLTCTNTAIPVSVKGTAIATAEFPCIYNICGTAITTDVANCPACIRCVPPVTCRVTGGGVLIPGFTDESCITVATTIFPFTSPNGLTIKKITHGGQLGAPFSQMDCGAILGNPCIRGQWSHTRHYEGQANPRDVIDMNFHSTTPKGVYDSLSCACLGCCDPETGVFIPSSLGPLIHKFQLCNPDDHKVCGPQPRPAPANAIIWSGIGKVTPEDDFNGSRAAQAEWVVFRIYIEDRSEPGGGHPGGAVEPADIYCFQAWKTGIKVSKKPDFTTISTAFRAALGQANCDFLRDLEEGRLPIGTLPSPTVQGLTADIQDCGPMHDGNHQIHPSTSATCDP